MSKHSTFESGGREPGGRESGGRESGGLEFRATDFGSGKALSRMGIESLN